MVVAEFPRPGHPDRPFLVAVMGSCRVYQPFHDAYPGFGVRIVSWPFSPFTYSPGESSQYFNFCRGRVEIPEWQRPMIFNDARTVSPPPELSDALARADLGVVEIGTLDQLHHEERYFNWNEVGLSFIRGQGEAHFHWWRELTDRSSRRVSEETVEKVVQARAAKGTETPPEVRAFLSGIRYETLDAAGLRRHLGQIEAAGPKRLLFVSHFNIATSGPDAMPDRTALLQTLREVAGGLGHDVFDPTPAVEAFGYRRALQGDGADKHHYTVEFNPEIGRALLESIRATLS